MCERLYSPSLLILLTVSFMLMSLYYFTCYLVSSASCPHPVGYLGQNIPVDLSPSLLSCDLVYDAPLLLQDLDYILLDGVLDNVVVNAHGTLLADPVGPVLGLRVNLRRPVHIGEHYYRGCCEIYPDPSGLDVADDDLRLGVRLEGVDCLLPLVHIVGPG